MPFEHLWCSHSVEYCRHRWFFGQFETYSRQIVAPSPADRASRQMTERPNDQPNSERTLRNIYCAHIKIKRKGLVVVTMNAPQFKCHWETYYKSISILYDNTTRHAFRDHNNEIKYLLLDNSDVINSEWKLSNIAPFFFSHIHAYSYIQYRVRVFGHVLKERTFSLRAPFLCET